MTNLKIQRNRLSWVKFLIIDELFIVSSDLGKDTDATLEEIVMMIAEKLLAGPSIMAVVDLLQLSPARGKLTLSPFFDKDSMNYL